MSKELEQLQASAAKIARLDIELLIQPKDAPGFSFSEVRKEIQDATAFYHELANLQLDRLPVTRIRQMNDVAANLLNVLEKIRDFRIDRDPHADRTNLIAQVKHSWPQGYEAIAPHLAWPKVSSSAMAEELARIKAMEQMSLQTWDRLKVEFHQKQEHLDEALAGARSTSAKAATAAQALEFEKEANENRLAARVWLSVTVTMLVVALIVTYITFAKGVLTPSPIAQQTPQSTNQLTAVSSNSLPATSLTPEILQALIARVIVVTLLYFGVLWAGKNYAAARHNFTVNRHRRNAMQTFRAYVEASNDQATRDYILRQAVACAFAPQQSGYLKNESLPEPPAQLVDPSRLIDGKSE